MSFFRLLEWFKSTISHDISYERVVFRTEKTKHYHHRNVQSNSQMGLDQLKATGLEWRHRHYSRSSETIVQKEKEEQGDQEWNGEIVSSPLQVLCKQETVVNQQYKKEKKRQKSNKKKQKEKGIVFILFPELCPSVQRYVRIVNIFTLM